MIILIIIFYEHSRKPEQIRVVHLMLSEGARCFRQRIVYANFVSLMLQVILNRLMRILEEVCVFDKI